VSFVVAADAYDRFMGRYSVPLAPQLADYASVAAGQRVLDVGSGPGALTTELVTRLGADAVSAVDPSEPFVAAAKERHPGVDVQRAAAEKLPFEDRAFDAALAQLVVHFMNDPVAGIREMARVTLPDGVVAACVWDHAGERSPLAPFWRAAHELDIGVLDESALPGARKGHLAELFEAAGLREIEESELVARIEYSSVDDWLEPFALGVGPAGAAYAGLDSQRRAELDERCRDLLGPPPFVLESVAWAARGIV
jgi:SAM-dependent methyltransferase